MIKMRYQKISTTVCWKVITDRMKKFVEFKGGDKSWL